jgi:hypothetical protein
MGNASRVANLIEQWKRIGRLRERLRLCRDDGRTDGLGTEDYRDELFAMFQSVWHLKDWIKNDPTARAAGSVVENRIKTSAPALRAAADVANGSKHGELTRHPRAGGSRQSRNDVRLVIGAPVLSHHTFYIQDHGRGLEHEALTLLDECLAEWRAFFSTQGITVPSI